MTDENSEWYADGLRFACTQCGHCCTGSPGYVMLTDDECKALAIRFKMDLQTFLETYTRLIRGERSLTEHETEHGFDCVFLDRETIPGKAICGVYEDRPQQCRTWPFWPENLAHPRDWQRASQTCPGINTGTLVPIEAIRIQRDETPQLP